MLLYRQQVSKMSAASKVILRETKGPKVFRFGSSNDIKSNIVHLARKYYGTKALRHRFHALFCPALSCTFPLTIDTKLTLCSTRNSINVGVMVYRSRRKWQNNGTIGWHGKN